MRELLVSELSHIYGGSEAQFENAARTVISLLESKVLDSSFAGALFTSKDYGMLAANMNSLQFTYLSQDYTTFMNTGMHAVGGQYGELVHPENIDWNAYSNGGHATADQAIQSMFNEVINHHHLHTDSNSGGPSNDPSHSLGDGSSVYNGDGYGYGGNAYGGGAPGQYVYGTVEVGEVHYG